MNEELHEVIMDYLNGEDAPILSQLMPAVMEKTGASREEIVGALHTLNNRHEFSMSIDSDLEIHFYTPWLCKCNRCENQWDATNYDTYGGGLYYTGHRLDKENICRDCEQAIVADWFARGKPKLKDVWDDGGDEDE